MPIWAKNGGFGWNPMAGGVEAVLGFLGLVGLFLLVLYIYIKIRYFYCYCI
jgi:hypothetical protein